MSTSTWTGAASSDWDDPDNWSPAGLPGQNSEVTIGREPRTPIASASIGTVNSIDISYQLSLESAGNDTVTTDLNNSGILRIDPDAGDGGTSLNIGGTLTNGRHQIQIGNADLSAPTSVTAAALDNMASLRLLGSASDQVLLNVAGAAGFGTSGVINGEVDMSGDSAIEFGSGQISMIARGAELDLNGNGALIEDGTALGSNSALAGLDDIEGGLSLVNGASVSTTGNLTNAGGIKLDAPGDSLSVSGTLTNAGDITVVNRGHGLRHDFITASSFVNNGTIGLIGNLTLRDEKLAELNVSEDTTNNGVIFIEADKEVLAGPVDGTGSFTLEAGGIRFDSSVSAGQTIYRLGADTDGVGLGQAELFDGTISGFSKHDWINAANFLFSGTTFNFVENSGGTGGTLTLHDGSLTAHILMTGDYSKSSFSLAPDSGTGTLVKFV